MRLYSLRFFALPLAALATLALAAPTGTQRFVRTLAPGVTLTQELTAEPALVVNAVTVDPKARGVRIEAALGQDRVWGSDATVGRETVSALAARRGALVAVNAGFFPFLGNPIGLHAEQRDLVTEPTLSRTSLCLLDDGSFRVSAFRFDGAIVAGDDRLTLHGLNRKPGKGNECLVFTPRFDSATPAVPDRVEVVIEAGCPLISGEHRGKVLAIGEGGRTPLSAGTLVISGGGASATWLRAHARVGESLTVRTVLASKDHPDLDPTRIVHAVTGAGRLVVDGQIAVRLQEEGLQPSFSTTRHPRTAVGVDRDGRLILLTIDGRLTGLSRGATLLETAAQLVRFGAVDGVNLDGGGSTTLAVRGLIVNAPSDGAERPVADMLIVTSDAARPDPSAGSAALEGGPQRSLTVGETVDFPLPDALASQEPIWGVVGGVGFVSQGGSFRALRPGSGFVRLSTARGAELRIPVTVVKPAAPP